MEGSRRRFSLSELDDDSSSSAIPVSQQQFQPAVKSKTAPNKEQTEHIKISDGQNHFRNESPI
eukprot:4717255-Amphidinium_carterae.1